MLQHNGYCGRVEFDDEAGVFHGEVIGLRDVVTFEATNVRDLRKAFRESVDDYLAFCAERGEAPEKPCSGKFVLRVSPELHRRANQLAAASGKSLNAWIAEQLEQSVGAKSPG
ncbi:type II toxin-antitoxin system HicB family antitoxin [Botrimarina sp.]|uniref:type II toxin-antitoxin system HicB family antitoxin n=1 Tax=Botrimarina sp. TaxID=2795802 RepID=UPI0032F05FCA